MATSASAEAIGLLGGTFDPVHTGHLHLASSVLALRKADRVIFMPTRQPPHKTRGDITPCHHRLEMLALATADEPRFKVSDLELRRTGPSFTVTTLRELHGRNPRATVRLIIGADMLPELHRWRDVAEVIERGRPLIAPRPGTPLAAETLPNLLHPSLHKWLPLLRDGLLDLPPIAMSSTDIRAAIVRGQAAGDALPNRVAAYIRSHGLYGKADR